MNELTTYISSFISQHAARGNEEANPFIMVAATLLSIIISFYGVSHDMVWLIIFMIVPLFYLKYVFVEQEPVLEKKFHENLHKITHFQENDIINLLDIKNPIKTYLNIMNQLKALDSATQTYKSIQEVAHQLLKINLAHKTNFIECGLNNKLEIDISDLEEILLDVSKSEDLEEFFKLFDIKKLVENAHLLTSKSGEKKYENSILKLVIDQYNCNKFIANAIADAPPHEVRDVRFNDTLIARSSLVKILNSDVDISEIIRSINSEDLKNYMDEFLKEGRIKNINSEEVYNYFLTLSNCPLTPSQLNKIRRLLPEDIFKLFNKNNPQVSYHFNTIEEFQEYYSCAHLTQLHLDKLALEDLIKYEVAKYEEIKKNHMRGDNFSKNLKECEELILAKINNIFLQKVELKYMKQGV